VKPLVAPLPPIVLSLKLVMRPVASQPTAQLIVPRVMPLLAGLLSLGA